MQHTFLYEAAQQLYEREGDNISSLRMVFPSRRARLFFSDALSQLISKPVWQPQYISMDELMCEATDIEQGDKLMLITELYNIYNTYNKEDFDKFYHWGEILLNDFDLIDKYLIDANMLFSNISDLKQLEADLSYLTPEMRNIISTFWKNINFGSDTPKEKEAFLRIWNSLAPIYNKLQSHLRELGVAYPGMIYRSAVENIKQGVRTPDTNHHYVFIGLNALSACEKEMLKFLEKNCTCDFIWDYDSYYTDNKEQEAGRFLRENISLFKPTVEITHNNFQSISKQFNSISTVSNTIQCKYIETILKDISKDLKFDKRTAIVLTDETLLEPLLHALPKELEKNINITMGYPLRQTIAYSFIDRLIELQRNCRNKEGEENFYHSDVTGIVLHPFITNIIGEKAFVLNKTIVEGRYIRVDKSLFKGMPILETIFSSTDDYKSLSQYMLKVIEHLQEEYNLDDTDKNNNMVYLSLIAENICRLNNCIAKCNIALSTPIYTSLLKRHLKNVRIPFSGEPLQGLQIMGILETRNLDFDNVIILSMNDDNFPGSMTGDSSFIPYNLRAAYGIPTPEHHEGVYAYYFYRLIQRAKRVDMLYCSHADQKSTGEKSRYIYQLDYESPYKVNYFNIGVDVKTITSANDKIEKVGKVKQALERFTTDDKNRKILSPSAFSNYVVCPMKFYFASIARLKTNKELEDDLDNPTFGTVLHDTMEILYKDERYKDTANIADLLKLITAEKIEKATEKAINKNILNNRDESSDSYSGNLLLAKKIIIQYIEKGIIPYDMKHPDFSIISTEEEISDDFTLPSGKSVTIGGRADRIDRLHNGNIRVVDYKTGSVHLEFNKFSDLFTKENRGSLSNILQTLIYSMVLKQKNSTNVQPALYYARKMHEPHFSPYLISKECEGEFLYGNQHKEFSSLLLEKIDQMLDLSIPFERCPKQESKDICKYCDFKTLCKREV